VAQLTQGLPRRWIWLATAMIVIAGFNVRSLVCQWWINAGMCRLTPGLILNGLAENRRHESPAYPFVGTLSGREVGPAETLFRRALSADGGNTTARWSLARVLLLSGRNTAAASLLTPAPAAARSNPLLFLDVLAAYNDAERPSEVISLWESARLGPLPQSARDVVALSYLNVEPPDALEKARLLRPNDLYINLRLWQASRQGTQLSFAETAHEQLVNFSLGSVVPDDAGLQAYASRAIADLLADGIWSYPRTIHVIAFLVSDRFQMSLPERLLKLLEERDPRNPDWLYFLGDLYSRRGETDRARRLFEETLRADPEYALACLRLGMLAEDSYREDGERREALLRESITWYQRFSELSPENPAGGLRKLAKVTEPAVSARHIPRTDSRRYREEWARAGANRGPAVRVTQRLDNEWTFLGYSINEEWLLMGQPAPLWVYWQNSGDSVPGDEGEGWYALGNGRWVQGIESPKNLVMNGSFELGLTADSPTGFPDDIYRYDSSVEGPGIRRLAAGNRRGSETTVAALSNTPARRRSSFVSSSMKVKPGALYLQAGWILGSGANAFLGRQWADTSFQKSEYGYVSAGVSPADWTHYGGVVLSPPWAACARLWLLNFESAGNACFDNVIFLEIGRPRR